MPLHWPGHNYLGPGTSDFSKSPVDVNDYIAYLHDLAYERATAESHIYEADKEAIRDFLSSHADNPTDIVSLVSASGLSIKNFVEEKILGRPLYGMPPPTNRKGGDKDWLKVHMINQARKRKQQEEADKENQAKRANTNEQPAGSSRDTMDDDNDVPMGNAPESEPQADVPSATGGSRGGSGGGMGGSGDGAGDIYQGTVQGGNTHTKEFSKSYHFTLGNGTCRRRLNDGIIGSANEMQYRNIHGIPWEMLAMYCSEGEMLRLFRNYSMVVVEEVTCEVFSLGVRLPFITGQTTSLIANSLAQYPVGKFHFDRDFYTMYDATNVADVIDKCLGSEWKKATVSGNATTWSEEFENITASTVNRSMANPVSVLYPITVVDDDDRRQMFPKDVGVYDYVNIKNGSTAYGKCWSQSHRPKQGILFSKSNEAEQGEQTWRGNTSNYSFLNAGLLKMYSPNGIIGDSVESDAPQSHFDFKRTGWLPPHDYKHIQVDNNPVYAAGDAKLSTKAMPKFLIGFVNVRNLADDGSSGQGTMLEAKWDIIIKCRIRVRCHDNVQRGYINRQVENVPFAYNPFFTLGQELTQAKFLPSRNIATGVHGKRTLNLRTMPGRRFDKALIRKVFRQWIKEGKTEPDKVAQYFKENLEHYESEDNNKLRHHVRSPEFIKDLKELSKSSFFQ